MSRVATLAAVPCALAWCAQVRAQDLVFRGSDFEAWSHPRGLVNVRPDGIEVKRFGGAFNAVANAHEFSSSVIGEHGLRPEWAPSNQADAYRVTDQDPTTWLQPDPDDPLQKWWLEVDLGRAVVATKVRVIFAEASGTTPFPFFSVYVSPGVRVGSSPNELVLRRLGRPVNGNTRRTVEFDLQTTDLPPATGEHMVADSTLQFMLTRFVRFEANSHATGAALAEIEVDEVGFNLATRIGTEARIERGEAHWGGRTWTSKDRDCTDCGAASGSDDLVDQDLASGMWAIQAVDRGNWRDSGFWGVLDFSSTFRIERIVWVLATFGTELHYAVSLSHWHQFGACQGSCRLR